MKKKGVSPIIATVVLIAIVIVIAAFLWFWYSQFIEEQRDKSKTFLAQQCVQNTEVKVKSSSCSFNSSNYTINMELSNPGSSKITKFLFSVKSQTSSASVESGKVLNPGTSIDLAIKVSSSSLDNEQPKEVEIIPVISEGSSLEYCEDQSEFVIISSC